MRGTVLALASLLLTAVFALASPRLIEDRLNGIEAAVHGIDAAEDIVAAAENLRNEMERERLPLSLFLTDTAVQEMEGYISDIRAAAEDGGGVELEIAKSRLLGLIDGQRRLSGFNLEAII